MSRASKRIKRFIGKTLYNYSMIEEGDRILVCVSGGKDSLILLRDFAERRKSFPIKFHCEAVHVVSDLSDVNHKDELEQLFRELDIPYNFLEVHTTKRIVPGRTLNCYWCAKQRRLEIFKLAEEKKFNKIALGHHKDDVIETYLLNIIFKAETASMLPVMKYHKYPMTIIRPLYYIEEKDIIELSQEIEFKNLAQECSLNDLSKRKTVKEFIEKLASENSHIRKNIFKATMNINSRFLLDNPQEV